MAGAAGGLLASSASAATFNDLWQTALPVVTFQDAVTNDNQTPVGGGQNLWNIDPGADVYSQELYERPTKSMDKNLGGAPAADYYYQQLDIVSADFALDTINKLAYFSINLVGQSELNQSGSASVKGFDQFYRVRIGSNADFAYGYMFGVKNPSGNSVDSTFNGPENYKTTQGWVDTVGNGAVTGTGLTVTGEGGVGYDTLAPPLDNEGQTTDIQARIVGNSVQLAIAYGALGIAETYFTNLIFEAVKGLTDPQNYFWNDEYTLAQAGSPYDLSNPPDGSVYELDTLKGVSPVPVPASFLLFLSGIGATGFLGWLKRKVAVAA